jgi:hypothetical protein
MTKKTKLPKNFGKERQEDFVTIRREWFKTLLDYANRYEVATGPKKNEMLSSLLGFIDSVKIIIKL